MRGFAVAISLTLARVSERRVIKNGVALRRVMVSMRSLLCPGDAVITISEKHAVQAKLTSSSSLQGGVLTRNDARMASESE